MKKCKCPTIEKETPQSVLLQLSEHIRKHPEDAHGAALLKRKEKALQVLRSIENEINLHFFDTGIAL